MKSLYAFASMALTLTLALASAQAQPVPAPLPVTPASGYPMTPAPGLYQALGGQAGIRALMDDFVLRLRADPRIGDQFKDTRLETLARQLSDQVCQLSGGPCVYQGRDMQQAHAHMNVTRSHFNALVEVLQASLSARGVPFTRQNQLLALLAPLHRDMVKAH